VLCCSKQIKVKRCEQKDRNKRTNKQTNKQTNKHTNEQKDRNKNSSWRDRLRQLYWSLSLYRQFTVLACSQNISHRHTNRQRNTIKDKKKYKTLFSQSVASTDRHKTQRKKTLV
jgi:hypothetical protein